MNTIVIAVVAVVVLVAIIYLLMQRRRSDGVASFQRQIDALSSEARRPVVNQVQRATDDDTDDTDSFGLDGHTLNTRPGTDSRGEDR